MNHVLPLLIISAVSLVLPPRAPAQNVSGYGMMPDPFLLLLREPAVHGDLGLTQEQIRRLAKINHSIDGELLATRGMRPEIGLAKIVEMTSGTRTEVAKLFSDQQQIRMRQIAYRLRGISCVLAPDAAEQLQLTPEQTADIAAIVDERREEVHDLQSATYPGKEAHQKSQDAIVAAYKKEQQAVLGVLDGNQRKQLKTLFGRTFDPAHLGHVSFKAPELSTGDEWINSEPLQFADLRGKVVALHFWAFGCGNCIRNYPWYREWNDSYSSKGLVIIGVHTPETQTERHADRVREKVQEAKFTFPVMIDDDKTNWNAWGNSMWPSVYLVDKQGRLRYWWYGELNWKEAGGHKIMGAKIEQLLAEDASVPSDTIDRR